MILWVLKVRFVVVVFFGGGRGLGLGGGVNRRVLSPVNCI